jgi:putative copper export protein
MRVRYIAAMKTPTRVTAISVALLVALVSLLLAAPIALADNGTGLAGPTTDKTVTFFCFGVIGFFAILVVVLTLIQERLERRKEQRKYDLQRYG